MILLDSLLQEVCLSLEIFNCTNLTPAHLVIPTVVKFCGICYYDQKTQVAVPEGTACR